MIDAGLIYLAYFTVVAGLVTIWFHVGERLLERRERKRDAQAIADLVERETVERDGARHLSVAPPAGVVLHAEQRFLARRTVARYHRPGAA